MLNEALDKINGTQRKKMFVKLVNVHSQMMADTLNGLPNGKEREAKNYSKMVNNLGEEFADDVLKVSIALTY